MSRTAIGANQHSQQHGVQSACIVWVTLGVQSCSYQMQMQISGAYNVIETMEFCSKGMTQFKKQQAWSTMDLTLLWLGLNTVSVH